VHQYYAMDRFSDQQSMSLFTIILATIGGLLIGGGVILIFAYNWDNIDRPMRTVLAFTPLIIAQILTVMALYPQKRGTAWREVSGVLLFCSVAAVISIIGQTYHISGDFQGFITWWFLLIFPLIYLLRAHFMTILMTLLGGFAAMDFSPIYFFCLIAILPYYAQVIQSNNTIKMVQIGWLWTLSFFVAVMVQFLFNGSNFVSFFIILNISVCLFLFGSIIEKEKAAWKRPMTLISA